MFGAGQAAAQVDPVPTAGTILAAQPHFGGSAASGSYNGNETFSIAAGTAFGSYY